MANDKRVLFAKFRKHKETGLANGFFISEDRGRAEEWPANAEKREADDPKAAPKEPFGFEALMYEFLSSMNMFHRLVPTTMTFMPIARMAELDSSVYHLIKKEGELISKENEFELFRVRFDLVNQIDRAVESTNALRAGSTNLPRMFLMGLISSYDAFLSKLIRVMFLTKPEMLSSSERNISFRELVELGSVEAAQDLVIEKEIETVIRKSHHDQIAWFSAKLDIPLTKDLDVWPHFIEACERRNLFTHTDGKVSTQYLSVCKQHGAEATNLRTGDQLTVDIDYLRRAIGIITEVGLKLIQVIWRKLLPDEIDDAASALNQVAFDLISRRRYKLAGKMLHFGLYNMKKHGTELVRKMMVVNLANCEKLSGNKDKAEQILEKEDWTAASDKFRVCVAAVKDDVDQVISLIETVYRSGEINAQEFREWPVFVSLKDKAEFVSKFEAVFGEPYFVDTEEKPTPPDESEESPVDATISDAAPSVGASETKH